MLAVICGQIGIIHYVAHQSFVMREEWAKVVKEVCADVLVIQSDRFWGPVHAILPQSCKEQSAMQHEVLMHSHPSNHTQKEKPTVEKSRLRQLAGKSKEVDPMSLCKPTPHYREGKQIHISRCGKSKTYKVPKKRQRYLSMITISNIVTGGTTGIHELHVSRMRLGKVLIAGIIISMVLKYSLKLIDILTECCGHKYVQVWNNGRTSVDKVLESVMLHGLSIVFTLTMQLTLCTLFLTFWREDHFVMTYIPGLAFAMFFFTMLAFMSWMVLDRLFGCMVRVGDWYIYMFWIVWLLWFFILVLPMIGSSIYALNFMFKVTENHWIGSAGFFSAKFTKAARNASWASGYFLIVAVVDMLVILKTDYDASRKHNTW